MQRKLYANARGICPARYVECVCNSQWFLGNRGKLQCRMKIKIIYTTVTTYTINYKENPVSLINMHSTMALWETLGYNRFERFSKRSRSFCNRTNSSIGSPATENILFIALFYTYFSSPSRSRQHYVYNPWSIGIFHSEKGNLRETAAKRFH